MKDKEYYNLNGRVYHNGRAIWWVSEVLDKLPEDAIRAKDSIYICRNGICYLRDKEYVLELKTCRHKSGNKSEMTKFVYCLNNNKKKCYAVYRLYAIAFIPNPYNYHCVKLKDGNPDNINEKNIVWCNKYGVFSNFSFKISKGFVQVPNTNFYINKETEVIEYDNKTKMYVTLNKSYRVFRGAYQDKAVRVVLSLEKRYCPVHVLYAKAFVSNPYNLNNVRVKDGNYDNICCENLEWCFSTSRGRQTVENNRICEQLPAEFINIPDTNLYINKGAEIYSKRECHFRKEIPYIVERGSNRYFGVSSLSKDKSHNYQLHILYAQAFLVKQSEEQNFVAAKNGNFLDVRKDNLYWTTKSEYMRTINLGKKVPTTDKVLNRVKETNLDIVCNPRDKKILEDILSGMTTKEVAEKYHLSRESIRCIINKEYEHSVRENKMGSKHYYSCNDEVFERLTRRKVVWATEMVAVLPFDAVEVEPNVYITKDVSCYYKAEKECFLKMKKKRMMFGSTGKERTVVYNPATKRSMFVHRLYAKAFVPNPANYVHVGFLDGCSENICIENLYWKRQQNQKVKG